MKITELQRVNGQNSRARAIGVEATLTVTEWKKTVEDFNGLCAYCMTCPFVALEHFLPITEMGTHVRNCVPACQKCNNLKKGYGLDYAIQKLGKETIDRIQAYLISREPLADEPTLIVKHPRQPKPPKRLRIIPPLPNKEFFTIEEVALATGMERSSAYRYTKILNIEWHTFPLGRRKYVSAGDVERIKQIRAEPWTAEMLIQKP